MIFQVKVQKDGDHIEVAEFKIDTSDERSFWSKIILAVAALLVGGSVCATAIYGYVTHDYSALKRMVTASLHIVEGVEKLLPSEKSEKK